MLEEAFRRLDFETLITLPPEIPPRSPRSQDTPLHKAAWEGVYDAVLDFLDAGAPVDAVNSRGATPLHKAAARGHLSAVNLLVDAGADVWLKDADGRTPLDWARLTRHHRVANSLERKMAAEEIV